MQQQLQAFRQATRQLALHTIPTRLHHLFKGQNQVKGKRLASLAIATHIAILPWQSCHTQQTRERLAQEVLRSQHRLSQAKDTQAIADYQHMPIRQIQLKGRTRWSSTIRRCTHPLYIHTTATAPPPDTTTSQHDKWADRVAGSQATGHAEAGTPVCSTTPADYHQPSSMDISQQQHSQTTDGEQQGSKRALSEQAHRQPPEQVTSNANMEADRVAGSQATGHAEAGSSCKATSSQSTEQPSSKGTKLEPSTSLPNHIFFTCPRCPRQVNGTKPAFDITTLDHRARCNDCQKSLLAKQWTCSCGLQWYACPHAQRGASSTSSTAGPHHHH